MNLTNKIRPQLKDKSSVDRFEIRSGDYDEWFCEFYGEGENIVLLDYRKRHGLGYVTITTANDITVFHASALPQKLFESTVEFYRKQLEERRIA